jgi:hypothetical protein
VPEVEIIKCQHCGEEFDAQADDLGTYFCKCRKKPTSPGETKVLDLAIMALMKEEKSMLPKSNRKE